MVSRLAAAAPEKVGNPRRPPARILAAGWAVGLAAIAALLTVRAHLVSWVGVWLMVGVLLAWIKLLMLLRLSWAAKENWTVFRLLAFFFIWPGTRPEPFLSPGSSPALAWRRLLLTGCCHATTGSLILWVAIRSVAGVLPGWAVAWLGMAGLSLLSHFGLFDLLAACWRALGVPVEKQFQAPIRATSLADFWGRRWNRAFADFARALVVRPLARRMGPRAAGLAAFVVSGLVHELAITLPAHGGYGGPTLYFLIQGAFAQAEALRPIRRRLRRYPILGWIWTVTVVLGPAPLLFPAPFLDHVVLPFLAALGTGAPAELLGHAPCSLY
jgi:hypothetical protein